MGSIDVLREQAFFLRSSGEVACDDGFRSGLEALLAGLANGLNDQTENTTKRKQVEDSRALTSELPELRSKRSP